MEAVVQPVIKTLPFLAAIMVARGKAAKVRAINAHDLGNHVHASCHRLTHVPNPFGMHSGVWRVTLAVLFGRVHGTFCHKKTEVRRVQCESYNPLK